MSTPATHQYDPQRTPLVITELSVLRAPGISPGFTLDDFSPEINIIYGPNASGKSTTARAIQAVIWPHQQALRGHHLQAQFQLEDEIWEIDANAGGVQRTRNGESAAAPLIAPLDDRGRYSLGLPELLASENQPLAQAILNESSGGFDLPKVAESLGFNGSVPPHLEAAHQVRAAAENLNHIVSQAESAQKSLGSRGQLKARLKLAHDAERELASLDDALSYRQRLADEADATSEIATFPESVHALTGSEPQHLAELATRIGEQSHAISQTLRQRDRWQQEIDSTGLSNADNPRDHLKSLARIVDQQSEIEVLLDEAERDLAAAISERTAHQKRLAADLNDEQLAAVDADGMREFADIAASYERIRARRTARDEVELWLGGVTPPENLEALQQGVETLQARLQHPNAAEQREISGKPRWIGAGAGVLLAVAGALLALWNNPLWWILAAVGVILAVLAWRFTSSPSPRLAAALENTYGALPLPQPAEWRAPQIRDLLGELRTELQVALVEQEKATRWQDLEQERQELDAAYAETDGRRANAIEKYGIAPDLKEESLRLLAENLGRWQAADAALHGVEGRRNRLKVDRTTLQARAGTILSTLGYTDTEAGPNLDDLERRVDVHEHAVAQLNELQQQIDDSLQPALDELVNQRDGIFQQFGLKPGDAAGMQALQEQRLRLESARERLADRAEAVREAWEALRLTPHLREMSVEQLHGARDAAEQTANTRADLEEQLQLLDREEIAATRVQHREHALTSLADAKLRLSSERSRIMQRVVGDLLLETVQQQTRDAALPIVFHRARELFAIITRGKYELQFEPGPPPEFTALDTGSGMTLALDQLSSGTRVQVLMAIRLAFVENVEVGPKLPVILDETLGNSDEFRASAIIDAAIDICRHGRQVFYFTAQGDEVARWLQRIDSMPEEDRPHVNVIELAALRRDAGFERLPIPEMKSIESPVIPSPAEYDAETWTAALKVPAIDPWAFSTGSVHLWHVIPDTDVLYALLQDDITTIGQITSLERSNPEPLDVLHPNWAELSAGLHIRADLIGNAMQMWRIGRAQAMPTGILADADMIDVAALEEMQSLQAAVGNDGQKLMNELETMDDPPLAEKPLEALELWMIAEGYVAQGNQMREEDIRSRLIELASPAIREGILAPADIDQIMRQVNLW